MCADRRKLKQAFFNILSNAVKFTPDGGTIEINVDIVDPIADNDSLPEWFTPEMTEAVIRPSVVISVSDTGVGISLEDLEHVFDPFYQTSEGARIKTPSTGLGLAITREIMVMHEGNAWALSDGPGKGSRFVLQLPFVPGDDRDCSNNDGQE